MTESEINQAVADEICATGQLNGTRFRRGDFVALLDGKVVAVTSDLDDALRALRKQDADPRRGMVCEIAQPIVDVIR